MSGSHTIPIITALVLFSIIVLNTNRNILYSTDRTLQAEYISTATSIGQRFIKEISSRAFDENTISSIPNNPSGFSANLGPESGELLTSNFDDIDDFNGYSTTISNDAVVNFTVESEISYVLEDMPDSVSNTRTRTKKITVRVFPDIIETDTFKKDTVQLNYYSSF